MHDICGLGGLFTKLLIKRKFDKSVVKCIDHIQFND